ncbi:hypothetical protein LEN26_015965 [Aphanomyces euteiches]|nr:hypothetical protein LEN26_015965 [Aphanomyces euteiches]
MLSLEELQAVVRRRRHLSFSSRMRLLRAIRVGVERPLVPVVRFDLHKLSDADSDLKFRFDVYGVIKLTNLLCVPHVVITKDHDRCLGIEALCITLNRMAYPKRFYDMMQTFERSRESLCRIFNHVIDLLYGKWHGLLYFCLNIVQHRLDVYKTAIVSKGSPLETVFGFIDGSKVETCRIGPNSDHRDLQRHVYSGHKRKHCLNFQGVTAPDGLCISFWGPIEGSRHDSTLLRSSELLDFLDANELIFGASLLYGDPAYGVSKWICSGYKGRALDGQKKAFNAAMSKVRQAVEWSFGAMKREWAMVTYKMQQKILLQSVGKVVLVAMLLSNCQCCHEGRNQISLYFGLTPPSLDEYLFM